MTTDLATIEAALAAATPGPWEWDDLDGARRELSGPMTSVLRTSALGWATSADAHLIVLLRNTAAELVERVKAAEAEVERATWDEGSIRAELDAAEATLASVFRELAESVPKTIAWNPSDAAYLSGQVDFAESVLDALNQTDGITPESAASDEVTRFTSANSAGVDETTPRAGVRDGGSEPDAVHYLTVVTDDQEPRLMLVCTAAPGAGCRKRPTDADEREWEWDLDDPDIEWVDGPCFAVEWIEAEGWDDAIRCEEGAVFPRWPVEVSYHDEGPWIAPVSPHPLLPFPSQCTSDITLRDEEHRLVRCRLTAGHDGDHEDGHGVTWTGGER